MSRRVVRCSVAEPRTSLIDAWQIEATLKSQPTRYRNAVQGYEQFYLIVVLEGVLAYADDRTKIQAGPGRMIVLRPGSTFTLETAERGYSGIAVEVRDPDRTLLGGRSTVADPSEHVTNLAHMLREELSVPSESSSFVATRLASLLVALALRETESIPRGEPQLARAAFWAARAREAIENSIYSAASVHDVLDRFPVSYRQLARYIRAEYEVSPKELQQQARLRAAERLLRETNWSVTTIAFELGFASPQHFISAFAVREGVTPGAWRAATDGSPGTARG
jgi:AraC-like DNA-binding protein